MEPRELRQALAGEVRDEMTLVASGLPVEEIGDTFERLSAALQALALCHLLESGGNDAYRENLTRSAQARRFFLSRLNARDVNNDRRLALSRTEALFDALAAGHYRFAGDIARLSPTEWHAGWEYEDDFCYYLYLHAFVSSRGDPPGASALLARFETAIDGMPDPRLRILRSLQERAPEIFLDSLIIHMQQRRIQTESRKDKLLEPGFDAWVHWPRCFVSVEGLALLSLARSVGLQVSGNIPLCPTSAQLPVTNRDTEDFFEGIDRILIATGSFR